jgi:multidrug efflux pump subunit AcrB
MSLASKTVENRHVVWALTIAAAVFGVWSYRSMPMQLFPDTAPPVVNVVSAWPGAAAEDVARDLSEPLEEEFAALEGIIRVRSTSQDNLSLVSLEFAYDLDVDLAAVDVQNAIARVRGELPAGIREPQVLTFSTADRPVITLGIGAVDLATARLLADEEIAPRIQRIAGVAAVDVFGGHVPAVLVEVDPKALEARRIPLERVARTLREHNAAQPAGRVRSERTQTMFRMEAWAEDVESLARVPIVAPDGGRVLLGDLATIRPGNLDADASFAVNGEPAIAVQVFRSEDANIVETVGRVRATLPELAAAYPDLRFEVGEESATFTEISVDNLLGNVAQALVLASILIFLFLGRLRSSLVTIISMPLSYGITFALMKAAGVQLDMVTLSAIILAVGMVVDATVVVLENVTRRRTADGLSAEQAAIAGADEVRPSVVAGAATTLVVLIPLLFLEGFTGKTFGPLALTLIFAFSSSVVVALVLVPVLALYTGAEGSGLDRFTERLVLPFTWTMDRLRDGYGWILRGALRARWAIVLLAVGVLAGALAGIRSLGMDVLPHMDGGSFFVALETPAGTSVEETTRVVRDVEAIVRAEPEVVLVQSQVGLEPGMRSAGGTGAQGPSEAYVTVTLTPRTERVESIRSIEARVRERIVAVPGVRSAIVRESGNTAKATTVAPVVVRLSGPDPLVLDRLADDVVARVGAVPGIVGPDRSWRLDQRRTRVVVDTLRAGQLGLSHVAVAAQLASGAEGIPAGEYRGRGEAARPLLVRYERTPHPTPSDLVDAPLFLPDHPDPVPARSLVRLEETTGQGVVTREALIETVDVTATVDGRPISFVTTDLSASLATLALPAGYEAALTGENRDLDESKGQLLGAFAVAVVAVYLLLVAQLRSFLHPLTILLTLPLSLAGVPLALAIAGKAVSMPVMVGLVLLVGTVVNSAILLLDFVAAARAAGTPRREALLDSVRIRFRPIMMTSLSTIVGMIPLAAEWALGAERFSPLAIAVIGGMAAATLLTLIVIPVFYDLFDDLAGLFRRRPAAVVPVSP